MFYRRLVATGFVHILQDYFLGVGTQHLVAQVPKELLEKYDYVSLANLLIIRTVSNRTKKTRVSFPSYTCKKLYMFHLNMNSRVLTSDS